jgi:cysteinyl-tRNA synthetase
MYVCGPTVYADAHIGHAMAAIIFDTVRRYLTYKGYTVKFVTNFTDVDDKIIRRAKEQGRDPLELANHYAEKYFRHLSDLNVLPAHAYPRVSQEMSWITQMITGLEEEGFAYRLDGDVYFRVTKDEDYGKLSGRKLDEALSGTRIEEDARKEHPGDFALWKGAKEWVYVEHLRNGLDGSLGLPLLGDPFYPVVRDVPLDDFRSIRAWIDRIKALPGFVSMPAI